MFASDKKTKFFLKKTSQQRIKNGILSHEDEKILGESQMMRLGGGVIKRYFATLFTSNNQSHEEMDGQIVGGHYVACGFGYK